MSKWFSPLAAATLAAVCFAPACSSVARDATEKTDVSFESTAEAFTSSISVVGSLTYGKTSSPVAYANPPRYRSFSFKGKKGDVVTATVRARGADAVAWILDASYNAIAYNDDASASTLDSKMTVTLPGNTSATNKTYYVVFREYDLSSTSFTVKLEGTSAAADFYACERDSDCGKVLKGCCPHQGNVAVNASQASAYKATLGCANPQACIAIAVPPDPRAALCNTTTKKCELVAPEDIACGGHTMNPHQCPAGYNCRGDGLAYDVPGRCLQQCGGFGGFECTGGGTCIDDPTDECDPANGGADCGGMCHRCGDVAFRCAPGYHTDWAMCTCAPDF